MKKLLLPLFVLLFSLGVHGQAPCVPGTLTAPLSGYIIPDSATNFIHGCAGQNYTQIVYIKVPPDTTLGGLAVTIDSFVIKRSVSGLPSALTVSSVPDFLPAAPPNAKTNFERIKIKGDSLACIKISGVIPTGTGGTTYTLSIELRAYGKLGGIVPLDSALNLNYYKIVIDPDPCFPQSVTNLSTYGFNVIGNIPNPFTQQTQIKFESASRANYELSVMNSVGQVVFKKTINATEGLNYYTLDASNWRSGMYSYSLSNGQKVLTAKMQIQ